MAVESMLQIPIISHGAACPILTFALHLCIKSFHIPGCMIYVLKDRQSFI